MDGGHTFTDLVSSFYRACGLDESGVAWCWGRSASGVLRYPPASFGSDGAFVDVATGDSHGCSLDGAGSVYCWGSNSVGQRGTDDPRVDTPILVPLPGTADQFVNGAHHSCALLTDGSVTCWGSNLNGQLGTEFHPTSTPRPVVPFGAGI